ncbi:MAG: lysophospholipid acyltransferase family protein [Myxococcota bacterium]|nr:lysophospholipid acyltransferase family protein [Myxococcota bacterium]
MSSAGKPSNVLKRLAFHASSIRQTWSDPEVTQCIDKLTGHHLNEHGYDAFGYSPEYVKKAMPPCAVLYRHYFRTKTYDIHKVPQSGRALLIANHSGQLPFDGAMIGTSLLLDRDPPRMLRAMVERWVPTLPYVSVFMARCGQVVGTPDNCRQLLSADEAILVFPEGAAGISKEWKKRYQLQQFGYGFMRLAMETNTPIIPVAVVGAEEQTVNLKNWEAMAKLLNTPAVPITPTILPLPMPTKYHILYGDALHFEGDANADETRIGRRVKRVKSAIEALVERGLDERAGVFR